MKKLRACIVSHSYPTKQATAQATFIKNEAHLLADDLDVEVHLPAVYALPFHKQYGRSREPDEEILPVHRFTYLSFPNRRLATITQKSISKNLLKSIKMHKPDIVHLHWLYPAGLAASAVSRAGYPVVLTIHGGDWNTNRSNNQLMPLLEKSLSACDKIICVGKELVEEIGSYNPKFKNKLVHIPHGIDTELFHPQSEIYEGNEFIWDSSKLNILCVANLYHGKGIDLLIEAVAATLETDRHHLHIISPAGDAETKAKVENLIELHSIRDMITFYGPQTHEQLVNFYKAADLVVLPSRKEGFGLVVAEAIACGTPVLATRSGGPEEIVTSDCGILVDSGNAENLANGLTLILTTLGKYQEEKMHQHIQNNFSISAKKKKLLSVYLELTN